MGSPPRVSTGTLKAKLTCTKSRVQPLHRAEKERIRKSETQSATSGKPWKPQLRTTSVAKSSIKAVTIGRLSVVSEVVLWKRTCLRQDLGHLLMWAPSRCLGMDKSTAGGASFSIPLTVICLSKLTSLSLRNSGCVTEKTPITFPNHLSAMGFVIISRPTTPKAILTSITPSYHCPLTLTFLRRSPSPLASDSSFDRDA